MTPSHVESRREGLSEIMEFFDSVELEPANLPNPKSPRSNALAPRTMFIPKRLPNDRLITGNESIRVAITSFECWPNNITLEFSMYFRTPPENYADCLLYADGQSAIGHVRSLNQPRLACIFSDGRYATNLRAPGFPRPHDRGLSEMYPVISVVSSGGGGGGSSTSGYWRHVQRIDMWPLPSGGLFTIIFDWPAKNIKPARLEFDGDQIREACKYSVDIWGASIVD